LRIEKSAEHILRMNKMKKIINLMLALITGLILIGCGATMREIRTKSHSERTNVF
jgi:hypothetical protein